MRKCAGSCSKWPCRHCDPQQPVKKQILSALLLALAADSTRAVDLALLKQADPPTVVSAFDWSGPYVGGISAWVSADLTSAPMPLLARRWNCPDRNSRVGSADFRPATMSSAWIASCWV